MTEFPFSIFYHNLTWYVLSPVQLVETYTRTKLQWSEDEPYPYRYSTFIADRLLITENCEIGCIKVYTKDKNKWSIFPLDMP